MTNQQPNPLLEGTTPGPWRFTLGNGSSWNGAIIWSDTIKIATMTKPADKPFQQKEADTRLIAAAPDLARENAELRQAVADAAKMFEAIIPMTTADLLKNSETGEIGPALLVIAESAAQCAASMRTALAQAPEPSNGN